MRKKTGIVFFPAFDWSISDMHPEREERLLYTRDQIFEEGVLDLPEIAQYPPLVATPHDIARVHFCVPQVDDQVLAAHRIAAGAAMNLSDKIMDGQIKNGFAIVRPPGHHAMRVVHGNRGFCSINNEAVVVEHLRRTYGIKKIAIVDTDVHHGDGTQDIFYHDPDVLFISFHQDGRTIFPGTGFADELGGPTAYAKNINIPLPPGVADKSLLYVVDNLILPILEDFQPEFVINSAGQDNHYTDPLGSMLITAQGYAQLTEKLKPDLAVLEGGYAIESALPYVNLAILLAMAGRDYSHVIEPDYQPEKLVESPQVTDYVHRMVANIQRVWEKSKAITIEQLCGSNKFYQRQKSIYYDTEYFEEKQLEKVRTCTKCPGYVVIDSHAAQPKIGRCRVLAVSIHNRCCKQCIEEGLEAYNEAKKDYRYSYVYLQDKTQDNFLTFNREDKSELRTEG
ncbi:histone deacetylase [Desulfofalx alkaliphila]|uniref:histone deacetylase family protein n=1 Tax=Desulfofalx alkaliphila TaxID=105483 RepID=UPI0004E17CD5|nr:histone deacetylase [Desulfofalx alkaliphila]